MTNSERARLLALLTEACRLTDMVNATEGTRDNLARGRTVLADAMELLQPPPTKDTVEVRIALAVGEDGHYYAYGSCCVPVEEMRDIAQQGLHGDHGNATAYTVTTRAPRPTPTVIEGEVSDV